jgi:DNA-binding transcriptional LysR family regulator
MTYESEPAVLNLHLQQLAYLLEVERSGTLTEAATRLHVSQPALSQSLAELERRLGVRLFERRGRRRVLTDAGRETVRYAVEVLARTEDLRTELAGQQRGDTGTLRVGMIDAAILYVLPETIRHFRESHPAVELRLSVDTSTALLRQLDDFALDLVFVVGADDGDSASVELLREPLFLYGPPGAEGPPSEAAWALYPARSRTRALIDEALLREGSRARVAFESDNPEVLRQLVELGLAWTVLPAAVAERGAPRLARYREAPVAWRTLLGVRRASLQDPRVAAFLGLATETYVSA